MRWVLSIALALLLGAAGYYLGSPDPPPIKTPEKPPPPRPTHEHPPAEPLPDLLAANVEEGALSVDDLLTRFRGSGDATELQSIAEILSGIPEMMADVRVVDTMMEIARREQGPRRLSALFFLAACIDGSGRVGPYLRSLLAADQPLAVRRQVVNGLAEFAHRNPNEALSTRERLWELARTDGDAEMRADAVRAMPLPDAALAALLGSEAAADVRAGIYEKLGDVRPPEKPAALSTLKTSFASESEGYVRGRILFSIVKLARDGAVPLLEELRPVAGAQTADLQDYIEILNEGIIDLEPIVQAKLNREAARP